MYPQSSTPTLTLANNTPELPPQNALAEWIIIALISVEIGLTLLDLYSKGIA